ncbi:unnamed protein product [Nesidiocoris tenuis]|uniref:Uncharacterized protein n=1 Tax=Nesidiocoris tenuis TaxID=355587 RepID=A0A6H5H8L0_9HEMI|nr:unnamed protein product [Nesidiocoris tenuis]
MEPFRAGAVFLSSSLGTVLKDGRFLPVLRLTARNSYAWDTRRALPGIRIIYHIRPILATGETRNPTDTISVLDLASTCTYIKKKKLFLRFWTSGQQWRDISTAKCVNSCDAETAAEDGVNEHDDVDDEERRMLESSSSDSFQRFRTKLTHFVSVSRPRKTRVIGPVIVRNSDVGRGEFISRGLSAPFFKLGLEARDRRKSISIENSDGGHENPFVAFVHVFRRVDVHRPRLRPLQSRLASPRPAVLPVRSPANFDRQPLHAEHGIVEFRHGPGHFRDDGLCSLVVGFARRPG